MDISNKLQTALTDIDNNISFLKNKVEKKQDAITSNDKLDYSLLSGTPTIPLSTSQLTNDSGFATSGYVDDALSGKQDEIGPNCDIRAQYVRMDINHYDHGDPDFDVETSVNMTRDDVYEISGVVSGLITDKLNVSSYVAPYKLPYDDVSSPNGTWFQEDIGATMSWSNTEIIPNDQKIVVASFTTASEYDHLVFPTLYSASNQNVIKTCEVWVKMAGDTTEAQGIAAIVVPSSYYIVDESNFPTKLKGEATNSEAYTYHVFVIRAVPRQLGTLCEVAYSHYINTNLSI